MINLPGYPVNRPGYPINIAPSLRTLKECETSCGKKIRVVNIYDGKISAWRKWILARTEIMKMAST